MATMASDNRTQNHDESVFDHWNRVAKALARETGLDSLAVIDRPDSECSSPRAGLSFSIPVWHQGRAVGAVLAQVGPVEDDRAPIDPKVYRRLLAFREQLETELAAKRRS